MTDLSIIIPAYDAAGFIAGTLEAVDCHLKGQALSYEIIVVDDGSADGSRDVISSWIGAREDVKLVVNSKNMGKGFAIKRGVAGAQGRIILVTDADLSFSASDITSAYRLMDEGCDVIAGNRRSAKSTYLISPQYFFGIFVRHCISYLFNLLVRLILGTRIGDTHCGFKCFRTSSARPVLELAREKGFVYDSEIIFLAKKYGLKVREMPVTYIFKRISTVHIMRDSFRTIAGLLRIRTRDLAGSYDRGAP